MNPPLELDALCAAAQEHSASDLLLHEGQPPRLRLKGRLAELEAAPVSATVLERLREACGAPEGSFEYDGSLTSGGVRFRVNLFRQLGRRAAVLRRIRSDIPGLETLGLPVGLLEEWCGRTSGIVIVCGPTGSGKSTTLAAALQWMNRNFSRHVVTIEDPVEYLFQNDQCIFTQREVGGDTASFADGLRSALRQTPDVILVGEIRDAVTAITAIQAAETGHLVLATLHSSCCSDAVERLQLLFPMGERDGVRKTLSGQLVGVLCQRLLPGRDGLLLAVEYFTNIGATRKYVADGKLTELDDFLTRADTAKDFLSSLVALVRAGRLDEAEALAAADRPQELERALRGISSASKATRQ